MSTPAVATDADRGNPPVILPGARPGQPDSAGWLVLPTGRRAVLGHALFLLVFALAVVLGRATRPEGAQLALVWPAAAVAFLWFAAVWGRVRASIAAAALLVAAIIVIGVLTGSTPGVAAVFGLAFLLQALAACAVYRRLQPTGWFLGRPRDLGVLVIAALGGALASALPGPVVGGLLAGVGWHDIAVNVALWVLRNAVSTILLVALALRLVRPRWSWHAGGAGRAELAAVLLAIAAAYTVVFGLTDGQPVAALLLPLSIWVALRFSTTVGAAHLLVVGIAVVLLTVAGRGPYAMGDQVQGVMLAQAFIGIVGLVTLVLALQRDEREYLIGQLDRARGDAVEREELLVAVIQVMRDGLLVVDQDCGVLLRNTAAEEMFGGTPDLGRRVRAMDGTALAPADLPWRRALRGEEVRDSDIRVVDPAGGPDRLLSLSARPLSGGEPSHGAVTICHDVTTIRSATAEVAASRDLFSAVLQAVRGQSIIGVGTDGLITVFNAGAEQLLGYTTDEVMGTDPLVFHDPAEIAARALELGVNGDDLSVFITGLRGPGATQTSDWTFVCKDGSRRRVSITVSAITDSQGTRTGYLGVAEDVTDRREHEASMLATLATQRQAVERLEEVDRVKTDFVASISHELRTPITSIIGYVDMLNDGMGGDLSPAQADLLKVVERNTVRLMTLIEDLLTLSHIESDAFRLTLRRLDLRETIAQATEALQPSFTARPLRLVLDLPEHPVVVDGDSGQLERAVMNLMTNAQKFTRDGGQVTVRLRDGDGDGHGHDGTDGHDGDEAQAFVEVIDTGIGIAPDDQARLFTRFFRSREATARAIQGTGLGLSIVRAIAEEHGGSVHVDSTLGVGTTFTLRIPLQRSEVSQRPIEEVS